MIWNLVAMAFAGLGAAGVALMLRLITRKKLPRWIIPAFAGAGMLSYQIYMEYTALDLIESRLPEGTVVLTTESESMPWRPWTYIKPLKTEMVALDLENAESRQIETGDVVARFVLYRFERQFVTSAQPENYLLNCTNREVVWLSDTNEPAVVSGDAIAASDQVKQLLCNS